MRIALLQLEADEGAIHEGAKDIGREIRPRKRALRRVDQVKSVEIAHEGQDRDEPPTEGRVNGSLIFQKAAAAVIPSHSPASRISSGIENSAA